MMEKRKKKPKRSIFHGAYKVKQVDAGNQPLSLAIAEMFERANRLLEKHGLPESFKQPKKSS